MDRVRCTYIRLKDLDAFLEYIVYKFGCDWIQLLPYNKQGSVVSEKGFEIYAQWDDAPVKSVYVGELVTEYN